MSTKKEIQRKRVRRAIEDTPPEARNVNYIGRLLSMAGDRPPRQLIIKELQRKGVYGI